MPRLLVVLWAAVGLLMVAPCQGAPPPSWTPFAGAYGRAGVPLPPPSPSPPPGEAPVNSVAWGYGTTGSAYGSFGATSYVLRDLRGSLAEFQDTFVVPGPLMVNHLEFGSDLGEDGFLEGAWHNPADRDTAVWLRLRDEKRGDAEAGWQISRFVDVPTGAESRRSQGEAGLVYRGLESPRIAIGYAWVDELGERDLGPQDDADRELSLRLHAVTPFADGIAEASLGTYDDLADPEADHERARFSLELRRRLASRTDLSFRLDHEAFRRQIDDAELRQTEVSMTGAMYAPFQVSGLRLRGHARYFERPSSFVETHEVEKSVDVGGSALLVLDDASLAGGIEHRELQDRRLDRAAVEQILTVSGTPRGLLDTLGHTWFPSADRTWAQVVVDGRRLARLSLSWDDQAFAGLPGTSFVAGGSPTLEPDHRQRLTWALSLAPRSPVNLGLTSRTEDRSWSDPDRSPPGGERRNDTTALLTLGGMGRLSGSVDLTSLDVRPTGTDLSVPRQDVSAVGFHGRLGITGAVALVADHSRIDADGGATTRERLTTYGIDYRTDGPRALAFTLAWGVDDFVNEDDPSTSFRARTLTLSSESRF